MKLPIIALIVLLTNGRTAYSQPEKVKFGSVEFYGTAGISIPLSKMHWNQKKLRD